MEVNGGQRGFGYGLVLDWIFFVLFEVLYGD